MLGGRYSLNIVTKFSTVSYSIVCQVLSKTSSDSCTVYLTVVNNNCCLNWLNGLRVSCITFSKLHSAKSFVSWSEFDCSDTFKSLFEILFICIRDNAPATKFVVPGLHISFGVKLYVWIFIRNREGYGLLVRLYFLANYWWIFKSPY